MSEATPPTEPKPPEAPPAKIDVMHFASDVREALHKHGETEMALMAQDCIVKMAAAVRNSNVRAAQLKSACDTMAQILDRVEQALYQQPPDIAKARAILSVLTKAEQPAKSTLKLVTGGGEQK